MSFLIGFTGKCDAATSLESAFSKWLPPTLQSDDDGVKVRRSVKGNKSLTSEGWRSSLVGGLKGPLRSIAVRGNWLPRPQLGS